MVTYNCFIWSSVYQRTPGPLVNTTLWDVTQTRKSGSHPIGRRTSSIFVGTTPISSYLLTGVVSLKYFYTFIFQNSAERRRRRRNKDTVRRRRYDDLRRVPKTLPPSSRSVGRSVGRSLRSLPPSLPPSLLWLVVFPPLLTYYK
jgi:hypothetical protein